MENLEDYIRSNRPSFDEAEPPRHIWGNIRQQLDDAQLEGFVKANLEGFGEAEPPAALWASIETKLSKPASGKEMKMVPMKRMWQMAAVFALLLAASFSAQIFFLAPEKADTSLASMAPELAEAEAFFSTVMFEKKQQIDKLKHEGVVLPDDTQLEMQQLDSAYSEMKKELPESQYSEKVISSMIINLQLRIEILNQQLQILEQINQQSHENAKSSSI